MMSLLINKILLASGILVLSLVVAMYSTLAERKVAAFIQDRLGPDRAGPWGILQPLADGIKLFFKEEFMPNTADKFLYILGPALTMFIALLTSAVIPWGPDITIGGLFVIPKNILDTRTSSTELKFQSLADIRVAR